LLRFFVQACPSNSNQSLNFLEIFKKLKMD
jgi:hypothetical protein